MRAFLSLARKVEIYKDALHKIAAWGEGKRPFAQFDEPASATTARNALAAACGHSDHMYNPDMERYACCDRRECRCECVNGPQVRKRYKP